MTARPTARPIATPLARPVAGAGDNGNAALLILDQYTAIGAWALRRLRSGATQNVRLRRSSDNSEQNGGFVLNAFDSDAAVAFAGAGSAFVTTAYDQTANSKNITQAATTSQPRIVNSGVADDGIVFDGSNDTLTLGARLTTGSITELTVAYWIKQATLTYCIDVSEYNAGATSGWGVGNQSGTPSRLQFYDATQARICLSGLGVLVANTWTHIAWVFDGSQLTEAGKLKLYVNGSPSTLSFSSGSPLSTSIASASTTFSLGWVAGNTFPCGSYRDFCVFQTALDQAAVSALYAS